LVFAHAIVKSWVIRGIPFWVSGLAIALVAGLDFVPLVQRHFDILQRIEAMTYDWRVRLAQNYPTPAATNLAAVFIDDGTLDDLSNKRFFGLSMSWPFPRQLHGRIVRELTAQQCKLVAFDVLFDQLRAHDPQVVMPREKAIQVGLTEAELAGAPTFPFVVRGSNQAAVEVPGVVIESDDFFSVNLRSSQRVVLGALPGLMPHSKFQTNAWAVGNIEGTRAGSEEKDNDGVLRRFKAFAQHRFWHPEIRVFAEAEGLDLDNALIKDNQIMFSRPAGLEARIELGEDSFSFRTEEGRSIKVPVPAGTPAFVDKSIWQMGIILAARELGLDLDRARIELDRGRIVLPGSDGIERIIPVDDKGRFLINWNLAWNDSRILTLSYSALLSLDELRHNPEYTPEQLQQYMAELRTRTAKAGLTGDAPFRDKLVVVGSILTGNNLADLGSTPLSKQSFLVSANLNVANAIITNQMVRSVPVYMQGLLIIVLGCLGGLTTWHTRGLWASLCILGMAGLFMLAAVWLYVRLRWWVPVVSPLMSLCLVYVFLETYWVVFAQKEQRRVKAIFTRLVSPEVVDELLREDRLALGGARRSVTVFFADVRGFTELADQSQVKALNYVKDQGLTGAKAEAYLDSQAREILDTVNLYLGTIANVIKKHNGTFDKYIGDCVMAFWGAPTPNPKHAVACVRAAVEAQREICKLNLARQSQNNQLELENVNRRASGQPPLPPLPLLSLGTGINTGVVTVGLMGSDDHILNYTAFGREVALASRLESISGRARIIISAATFNEIQQYDRALAALCVRQTPVVVRGFRQPVETYEVTWKPELVGDAGSKPQDA
jgi:class 3 adenylate cyclase/CHASE2 domain-containing sensor protein